MAIIIGTAGPDGLYGTDDPDLIQALAESDIVYGFGGADRIEGGEGDDVLYGGAGDDLVYGGSGNDTLIEDDESSSDRLYGEDGDDRIQYFTIGGVVAYQVELDGGAGADVIEYYAAGTADRAILNGGTGNDIITALGSDHVAIDAGADSTWSRSSSMAATMTSSSAAGPTI